MVHIRKIRENECGLLLELMLERYNGSGVTVNRTVEGLHKQLFQSRTLNAYVVDMGSEIGGYCLYVQEACASLDGDGYRVVDTYLKKPLRRGGLGKAFLQTLGMIAQDEGKSFLCWDMPECTEKDRLFFTNMGAKMQVNSRLFTVEGKEIEYFSSHCACHNS